MMDPTNGKTARNHVLPGPMREQRGGEENAGFDEILLSPDRLARLVDNNDIDMNHLNIYHQHHHQGGPTEHIHYISSDEDHNKGKIQRVLPALEDENILKSNNNSDLEVEEEQKQRELPPVKLQKVRSEDLSWLDTIIYNNTTTTTTTTTTTPPTVKQQRGDSVRSDKKSGCLLKRGDSCFTLRGSVLTVFLQW